MSYILDALKKLEKERRRGKIPGLSEQDSIVYHSQRRPVWPYILIAVFVLNAALLFWWFLPKKSADSVMPAAPASQPLAAPSASQDVKMPEVKEPAGEVASGAAAGKASVSSTPVPPPAEKDSVLRERLLALRKKMQEDEQKSAGRINGEQKADHERQKVTEVAILEGKPEVAAEPLPEKKLYKFSELPPSVKGGLPVFSITAFLYSEKPSGRMARINERMMREGQELSPGIRVEEIVTDGVILSYRKFHFFVSVK
ncbi:MAG: general secretion pathway protein GspB [Nitrospirae bacterium]|nr:general secretion pathway protein GspB [Nitrospirota bacterium]